MHVVATDRIAAEPAAGFRATGAEPEPRARSAAELATAAFTECAAVGATRVAELHRPVATAGRREWRKRRVAGSGS